MAKNSGTTKASRSSSPKGLSESMNYKEIAYMSSDNTIITAKTDKLLSTKVQSPFGEVLVGGAATPKDAVDGVHGVRYVVTDIETGLVHYLGTDKSNNLAKMKELKEKYELSVFDRKQNRYI